VDVAVVLDGRRAFIGAETGDELCGAYQRMHIIIVIENDAAAHRNRIPARADVLDWIKFCACRMVARAQHHRLAPFAYPMLRRRPQGSCTEMSHAVSFGMQILASGELFVVHPVHSQNTKLRERRKAPSVSKLVLP
jgi:hypothetical protein